MPQQFINVGTSDNDSTGDWPKQAGTKINLNFQELYSITAKVGHTHTANEISDSTIAGRTLLTAPDQAAQRSHLGILPNTGTLDGLSDVVVSTPATGHYLRYNGTQWTNTAFTVAVGNITASGTPGSETFLRGDGTWAVPAGGGGGGATTLDGLTDVAITLPSGGHTLRFTGTSWVNAQLSAADVSGVQATDPGLTSIIGLSGAGVVTTTATDAYAMRPLGVGAANAIPDRAAADPRYALLAHQHAAADITSGVINVARLGTGTASTTTYLRGDGAWAAVSGGGGGQAADAGLTSLAGLVGAGVVTATATDTFAMRAIGVGAADSIPDRAAADGRYAAGTHNHDGSHITTGTIPMARLGSSGTRDTTTFLRGDGTFAAPAGGGTAVGVANLITPEAAGFATTRDGTGDNTAALNGWFEWLATNRRAGYLPEGDYRTTGELVLPREAMYLRGAGRRYTRIRPAANTYHGFRAVGDFTLEWHGRFIGGFSVIGPGVWTTPPPRNGKCAFILDRCPQAHVDDVMCDMFDIGFGGINNSYNAHWSNIWTNRNDSNVNCGFWIGEGNTNSGSDWVIYNLHVSGRKVGLCIAGLGGGYRVYGYSVGTQGNGDGEASNYAPIVMGWDYPSDSLLEGIGSVILSGGHIEGWRNTYAFRFHGELTAQITGTGINPSAPGAEAAHGLIHHSNARNSKMLWTGNDIGPGQFQQSVIAKYSGDTWAGFVQNELSWGSAYLNYAGNRSGLGSGWLQSLMKESNLTGTNARGFSTGSGDYGQWTTVINLGRGMLMADNNNQRFMQSWDGGATWTTI